jgi:hypothetical protein
MTTPYLAASEYATWGLPASTPAVDALVLNASALINGYTHRPQGLGLVNYAERLILPEGRNQSRLTYTPWVAWDTTSNPANPTGLRGRYGTGRRGDGGYDAYQITTLATIAAVFGGPPAWNNIDTTLTDIFSSTGEIWVPAGIYQTHFTELEANYQAGYAVTPDAVKWATVAIAQALLNRPAPGVKVMKAGDRTMEFFGNYAMTDEVKIALEGYRVRKLA